MVYTPSQAVTLDRIILDLLSMYERSSSLGQLIIWIFYQLSSSTYKTMYTQAQPSNISDAEGFLLAEHKAGNLCEGAQSMQAATI